MQGDILANRSSKKRSKADFYNTPPAATIALADYLNIDRSQIILDPACGEGMLAKTLTAIGYKVLSRDLYDYNYGESGVDFLNSELPPFDWLITNPPFSRSVEFINRAIQAGKPFAFLLKSQYWHSVKRLKLFQSYRPSHVLGLTWRLDFEFGKRGGNPTMECLWTIWNNKSSAFTTYDLLPKPLIVKA